MTVTLRLKKANKVASQLIGCLILKRLDKKRVQRLLGLLRSTGSTILGGLGLFTSLKHALSLPRRIRINDALHEELKSRLSLVQDLRLRPIRIQAIIPPPPTWFSSHNVCKHGLSGVLLFFVSHILMI